MLLLHLFTLFERKRVYLLNKNYCFHIKPIFPILGMIGLDLRISALKHNGKRKENDKKVTDNMIISLASQYFSVSVVFRRAGYTSKRRESIVML